MAISIIIEDGSNVPNANSYVSLEDARTYANNRGLSLPTNDDVLAGYLIQATDYLESFACEYLGEKANLVQTLQFPRKCMILDKQKFPENAIPKNLIAAQIQLALAQNDGYKLFNITSAKDYITKKTVDVLTIEYADPIKIGVNPRFSAVDALLAPLFGKCGQAAKGLITVRA